MSVNDFTIHIGTVNGSGSQSANNILVKSLFRIGVPVCGKNLFPSNIQGNPTWFTIRVSTKSYLSRSPKNNIVVGMNQATVAKDINDTCPGGLFIYNNNLKFDEILLRDDVTNIGIPFKDLVKEVTDSIKLKKLLTNIIYVGIVAEIIGLDKNVVEAVINDQFQAKGAVAETNIAAFNAGFNYALEHLKDIKNKAPFKVEPIDNGNAKKILIDGNTAASLGLVYGGCSFMAWYPITPSSSIAEGFSNYAHKLRTNSEGKNNFSIVQAEDELSAISMTLGSGWAGGRAITCTSGPGLSLMAEAAGLSYFAEIPAVIWDVQRGGPSTGLPTRTQQSDILSAATLSHGDTEHILLFPKDPKECFEFGRLALDLSEQLQTLVIVLTDLDLGMNFWVTDEFHPSNEVFERGKVLNKEQLNEVENYGRYKDIDGDAIPYRSLPGTEHPNSGSLTRGTGHDEMALYSEDNETYKNLLLRLKRKFETAKEYMPKPEITSTPEAKVGLISFGSTGACILETQDILKTKGLSTSHLTLKAFPFTDEVENYISNNTTTYVVEQNRDAQMHGMLTRKFPNLHEKLKSVTQFDGLPITANFTANEIRLQEGL